MRLQTGKIVLKYIENFVRREREAVNRFRDFLSDVVRQSDMVLLSLCTVSTLYGMVLIASATHFRNTFKYVAIQGFGLLLGVLLYFLLSSIDVSEVGKKWKWLLAFNFGFILLLRTPFGLTRNGNRAWLGVNDIGKRLGVGLLENFPITVQPAEIVKITFIILLARQLALLQEKKDLTRFSNVIQPTAHAGAMFVFYYILSKDAGSGLVYLFVFLCMAFAAGFALRWIFLGVGGAVGGFTTGRKEIIDMLRQRSRPYLFSNSLPPAVVGAGIETFKMLAESHELHDRLVANVEHFRAGMMAAGFDIKPTQSAICAVMLYDAKLSQEFAAKLQDEGVFVTGFYYPVVPKGQARIRVQVSAGHTIEQLDRCIAAFTKVGKELNVIK